MQRIMVTGALGQIGTELTLALRKRYGVDSVVACDIRAPAHPLLNGPFVQLDCTRPELIDEAIGHHRIDTVFHLAAILSALAEGNPLRAWQVNMGTLVAVLEVARARGCSVFNPSSIGAFGPTTPHQGTPQDTLQRPTSMYGVTKVSGELLCDYYHHRYSVDTRGLRFPGIISNQVLPGGGTTDYAVEIYYEALREGRYTSFLGARTFLDMMYMPDAIQAAIALMEADPDRLMHRNAFNVTAMSVDPEAIAASIRRHLPDFELAYDVDPVRQAIADSWPDNMDDTAAREEWGWRPAYDLDAMTDDMLRVLRARKERGDL